MKRTTQLLGAAVAALPIAEAGSARMMRGERAHEDRTQRRKTQRAIAKAKRKGGK